MKPALPWDDTIRLLSLAGVTPDDPRLPRAVMRFGLAVGTYHRVVTVRSNGIAPRDRERDLASMAGALRKALRLLSDKDLHGDLIDGWQHMAVANMDENVERRWANELVAGILRDGRAAEPWLDDMAEDVQAISRFADAAEAASARYSRTKPVTVIADLLADLWEFLDNEPKGAKTWDGPYVTKFSGFALEALQAIDGESAHGVETLKTITATVARRGESAGVRYGKKLARTGMKRA